jgi:uncharacterized membrane protein YeaQ/YmgE (transglycosylase-associated protein family)
MEIVVLIGAMIVVGVVVGWAAGLIWKDNRPLGAAWDFIVSVFTAVAVGLLDWYVIPAMGFSESMRNIGVAIEPALAALLVLWLIRRARS